MAPRDELEELLPQLRGLQLESQELVDGLESAATKARAPEWREVLSSSGILSFALEVLDKAQQSEELRRRCLRIVGNACIDNNANREAVMKHSDAIRWDLNPGRLVAFASGVLNNLTCDYEPAQKKLVDEDLMAQLVAFIEKEVVADMSEDAADDVDKVFAVFDLFSPRSGGDGPLSIVVPLLDVATRPRIGRHEFSWVASLAAEYLAEIGADAWPHSDSTVLSKFLDLYECIPAFRGVGEDGDEDEKEDTKRITLAQSQMLRLLADIADDPRMRLTKPFEKTLVFDRFESWLEKDSVHMRAAGCLGLGNMIRSPEAVKFAVDRGLHKKLISCISDPKADTELHHAALGVLRNMSIALTWRETLAEEGLLSRSVLRPLWESSVSPDTQMGAVGVARLLITKTPANVKWLVGSSWRPESEKAAAEGDGPDKEAASTKDEDDAASERKPDFASLLTLHRQTDVPQIKLEVARIANIVCLTELSTQQGKDMDASAKALLDRFPEISTTLAYLITQDTYPVLRSEAWAVLAILVQTAAGCAVVSNIIGSEGVLDQLRTAAMTSAGAAKGTDAGKDASQAPAVADAKAAAESASLRNDRVNVLAMLGGWVRVAPAEEPLREEMEQLEARCREIYRLEKGE